MEVSGGGGPQGTSGLGMGRGAGMVLNQNPPGGRIVQDKTLAADNINPQAPDCYFYYYSTCSKGRQCKFRHCSAALGTEVVCDLWLRGGECRREVCAFRHMVAQRQRSAIQCYWEDQPSGCLKPHCPFLHTKPRNKSPNLLHRLEQFKKAEEEEKFASLKVKSLDEIRNEKQQITITSTLPTSQGTPHTLTVIPPTSTSPSTSFQLTSVLKTTGIRVGEKKKKINSDPTTVTSQPQPKSAGVTMAVEEGKSLFSSEKNLASMFSPNYQPEGWSPNYQSGGGSPNYQPGGGSPNYQLGGGEGGEGRGDVVHTGASISWGDVKMGEEEGKEERIRLRMLERVAPQSVAKKVKTAVARPTSQPSVAPPPPPPRATSSPIKTREPPTAETKPSTAASRADGVGGPRGGGGGGVSGGGGGGGGGGGRGDGGSHAGSGVGDFRVKTLEEIKAEKRKRKGNLESTADGKEEKGPPKQTTPTATPTTLPSMKPSLAVRPQPVKKIVRVKRGTLTAATLSSMSEKGREGEEGKREEEGVRKEGIGGMKEGRREGKREEGRKKEGQSNREEQVEGALPAPSAKRRKLSRTTIAPVQATPTLAPPAVAASGLTNTTAVAMVTPRVANTTEPTATKPEPNQTKPEPNQTKPVQPSAKDGSRPPPAIDFTCIDRSKPIEEMESEREANEKPAVDVGENLEDMKNVVREGREGGEKKTELDVERRMSVSEMKAQIQSELRGRSDSDILSYDQLDDELKKWEAELGREEEEGEEGGEGLLDSKTDDDLMLEFAEFL